MVPFLDDIRISSGVVSKIQRSSMGDESVEVLYDPQKHSDHVLVSLLNEVLNRGKYERSKEIRQLLNL